MRRSFVLFLCPLLLSFATEVSAKDYYVSANRGKGKRGTKEKPAKNIGNLLKKVQAGDTIHMAQGTYFGRANKGSVTFEV